MKALDDGRVLSNDGVHGVLCLIWTEMAMKGLMNSCNQNHPMHICLLLISGFSNVYHSACVWRTALKLGCLTNLDTLFLVMGFISLIDEIPFMLK